ncbi:glycosyltransferase [Kocuria soli]|uniref:D-inositol 3-phosphate glycosyltransferase n=2 Tax=Kocuria soli TaxID=2485125 RepID=A0A3N3ZRQ7_9MICC|nr:glycosyltransferase [Kocuria soli]
MFPDAPIYTTLYHPEGTFPEFAEAKIITSRLNRVGLFRHHHRAALPLLPLASSLMKVPSGTAIVSSSGWAHGFRYKGPTVVYCHTPARWVYLMEEYLGTRWWKRPRGVAVKLLHPLLKRWDHHAMAQRDYYLGNSTVVQERIRNIYGRQDVGLIHPPHAVDTGGELQPVPEAEHLLDGNGYFLVVSRLLPYKNVDAVIEAAAVAGKRLLVVGRGPLEMELRSMAHDDVLFVKDLTEPQLRWAYAHATALVAVSYEDFGITPLEASAWGVPTIALRAGGYLDTIRPGVNGIFTDTATAPDIARAMQEVQELPWDPEAMKAHADLFSEQRFAREIDELLRRFTGPPSDAPPR